MSRIGHDVAKRALDVGVAGVALVVTAPVQVGVALAVLRRMGRPVLFRQVRAGMGGRSFTLVKFRTMHEPDPERGLVDNASRLTALGQFLRSTSLDELPTLWNVLRGDLSLVGPRPLHTRYLERYTPEQARRHEVRPGVTGLAQVSGRNALSWDEKFRLDVDYVDNRSFLGDLALLARTVRVVVNRSGISAPGDVAMPEFMGDGHQAEPT